MKMFKNASMLLAGLAALMLSVAVQASPIYLKKTGWTHGDPKIVSVSPALGQSNPVSVYAGEFKFEDNKGNTLGLFCIDLSKRLVESGDYHEDSGADKLSADTLSKIAWLYDNSYTKVNGSVTSAAFQIALWAIVTNNFLYKADDEVTPAVTGMLEGVGSVDQYQSNLYNIFVYTPKDPKPGFGQILVGVHPVPEPGTLALLGLGLLGAGAIRRRSR